MPVRFISLGFCAYPRERVQSRITVPKRPRSRSGFPPTPERFRPPRPAMLLCGLPGIASVLLRQVKKRTGSRPSPAIIGTRCCASTGRWSRFSNKTWRRVRSSCSLDLRTWAAQKRRSDVATSLNNLAGLDYAQGSYAQAEPLFRRALQMTRKATGQSTRRSPSAWETWRRFTATKAATSRPSRPTSGRLRSGKRCWAPSTPMWRPASVT